MSKPVFFMVLVIFLLWSTTSQAQSTDSRSVASANLSLIGPISTSVFEYDKTDHIVCLGFLHCGSNNLRGLGLSLGVNTVHGDMDGLAASYLGSVVIGDTRGLQLALLGHINVGSLDGLQVAVVNGVFGDHLRGSQWGLVNYSHGNTSGFQLGYLNGVFGDSLSGSQMGVVNYSHGNTFGAQFGYFNGVFGQKMKGAQFGLMNYSHADTGGVQFSILNYNHGSMKGLQFAILNIISDAAHEPETKPKTSTPANTESRSMAIQIGLVNVSQQKRVIPIGFINFVRGGRFDIALERGIYQLNRLSLKMGSRYFYTIFMFNHESINPHHQSELYHDDGRIGGGVGLGIPVTEASTLKIELMRHSPTRYASDNGELVRLVGEIKLSNHLAFDLGVERHRFDDFDYPRSLASTRQSHALALGVSFNLLGSW